MKIYINGQDINRLAICEVSSHDSLKIFDVGPEDYLKTIDEYLESISCKIQDITHVYLVIGPGSPTSLRSVITIVNTMCFVTNLKVYTIEKAKDEQDVDTVGKILNKKVVLIEKEGFLSPFYESEPKITKSTRDQLKNKLK